MAWKIFRWVLAAVGVGQWREGMGVERGPRDLTKSLSMPSIEPSHAIDITSVIFEGTFLVFPSKGNFSLDTR